MNKLAMVAIFYGTIATLCYAQDASRVAGQNHTEQKSIIQKIDANDDGVISHDEFVTARDKCFKAMDKNGDGMLSKDEFSAGADKAFATADSNKDGSIDCDEVTSLYMWNDQ